MTFKNLLSISNVESRVEQSFLFPNLKVIQKEQWWHNRKVKDALLVNCMKPALNTDIGLELSVAWKSLFQ